jgi:hypothetical protein
LTGKRFSKTLSSYLPFWRYPSHKQDPIKMNKCLAAIFVMIVCPSSFGSNNSIKIPILIRDLMSNFHAFASNGSEFTIQGHRQSELMQCVDQPNIGINTCKPRDGKIESENMGLMVQHHKVYFPLNGGRMHLVFATIPTKPCFAYKDFRAMLARGYFPNPPAVPAPPPLNKDWKPNYSNFKPVPYIPSSFAYFNYYNLRIHPKYKDEAIGTPYLISVNNNDETEDYCVTELKIQSIMEN